MTVTLTNESRALLTVELRSGDYIHLAPGETSRALEEHEIQGNAPLRKLVDRKSIAVITARGTKSATPERPTHTPRSGAERA